MERQRKYILVKTKNGSLELRFGYPFYHKDLLNQNENPNNCIGGGMWLIDSDDMSIILYGSSSDFGAPNKQDVKKAIENFDDWDTLEWICRQIYKHEIHLSGIIKCQV